MSWLLISAAGALGCWLVAVGALLLAGRGRQARALVTFVPDCVVLLSRLFGDPRVSRAPKVLLGACLGYLVLPLDLVPDFIPVAGQLDDALVVALALRAVLRGSPAAVVRDHWSGPPASLDLILRTVGRPRGSTGT